MENGKMVNVRAEVHSDDHVHSVEFDATPYLTQASDRDISELIKCEWGVAEPADNVADFFRGKNEQIDAMFSYLDSIQGLRSHKDLCGFECQVDIDEATAWVQANRPHLMPVERKVADTIYPKVIVLCRNAEGEPEFHSCTPEVTHQEMIDGVHYDKAIENAQDNGYEGPFQAFDMTDRAAKQLRGLADWAQPNMPPKVPCAPSSPSM